MSKLDIIKKNQLFELASFDFSFMISGGAK